MSRPSAATRKTAKGEYIETESGNKVSRRAFISGTANITLGGRTVIQAEVHLRGDLYPTRRSSSESSSGKGAPTSVSIGRCTIISTGCVIKPPHRITKGEVTYYPLKIGDNVFVGAGSVVEAMNVGNHVHIGEKSVLQPFCIIRENVKILPHSVIPSHMVIPSNSVVGGRPAQVIGELAEGWGISAGTAGAGANSEDYVEGGDLRSVVRSIR